MLPPLTAAPRCRRRRAAEYHGRITWARVLGARVPAASRAALPCSVVAWLTAARELSLLPRSSYIIYKDH